MKQILKEIQSGEFAKQWIEENEKGRPNFGPDARKGKDPSDRSRRREAARDDVVPETQTPDGRSAR